MTPDHIELARRETLLMREYLALPSERPSVNECIWIESLDTGIPPPIQSTRRLREIVEHYGSPNVTTAPGIRPDKVGIYVRTDVLEKTENPLWTHLSQPERRTHKRVGDWTDKLKDDRRLT